MLASGPVSTTTPDRRGGRLRRAVGLLSAVLLLASLILIGILDLLSRAEPLPQTLIIGGVDGARLATGAAVASGVFITVMLCAAPARGLWLWLFVPARIAAGLATGVLVALAPVLGGTSVVPLVSDGCRTGYEVVEEQRWTNADSALVGLEGVVGTVHEHISSPDSDPPFAADRYVARIEGDEIRVWRGFHGQLGVDTSREPDAVLPVLPLVQECGIRAGSLAVPPALDPARAPTPPGPTSEQISGEVARMTRTTLAAAVGPVLLADGTVPPAPIADDLVCGDTGVRVALDLRTGDNAASLQRILAAWDEEGYSPDRALGEDRRYRDDIPVLLSIRDRSTVDGLLGVTISASCPEPAR